MLFNAGVQVRGLYLLVTASGEAEFPELCALADFTLAVARRRESTRVLFDLLALRPVLNPAEHIELSKHIAQTLVGFDRIGVVLADRGDQLAADLAAARGLPLRTFQSLLEADDWIVAKA